MDIIESLQKKEDDEGGECLSDEVNEARDTCIEEQSKDADLNADKKVASKDGDSDSYVTQSDGETEKTGEEPAAAKRQRKSRADIEAVGPKMDDENDDAGDSADVIESEEELKKASAQSKLKRKRLVPRRSWSGKTRADTKIARSE